ncbi:non-structural maintenance of chromosomes element 3 homolog [Gordionus sp. m RMFG-2023]|uniref:non-structural maintenance of chromosomes element 3 homolog n=1 Tax=Gordionus sp. m RMFG-2023 TaxID=3053472 RepID=UPI0031FC402F
MQPKNDDDDDHDFLDSKVKDTIFYLLVNNQKQTIIKRADLTKYIIKDKSRYFDQIIKRVADELNQVFGYDITYIESQKGYLLFNKLPTDRTLLKISQEKETKLSLIFLIASHIYNSGGSVTEKSLWKFLKLFGIQQDIEHTLFGDVKRLIYQLYVKECYFEIVDQDQETELYFKFGPRCLLEMNNDNFIRFNNELIQL